MGVDRSKLPASLIIEVLREEGPAENVVNNLPVTNDMVGGAVSRGCGCEVGPSLVVLLGALGLLRRGRPKVTSP